MPKHQPKTPWQLRIGDKRINSKTFRPKPMKTNYYIQMNGKLIPAVRLKREVNETEIKDVFVPLEVQHNGKHRAPKLSGQTGKIHSLLKSRPNEEISSVELHRAGSGKDGGWCNSLSRRISDCRALGMNVVKCREKIENGIRHTFYKFIPPQESEAQ